MPTSKYLIAFISMTMLRKALCFLPISRHTTFRHIVLYGSAILDDTIDTINVNPTLNTKVESKETINKQFLWEKQWYPLAVEEYTAKNKTNKLQLLGNDIVLWHDGNSWRVFEDSCPHRGVPLSEGRVEKNGELLCAYHAWTFDGEGKCTGIPQTKTDKKEAALLSNPSSCVKSYSTQVAQDLIWVS